MSVYQTLKKYVFLLSVFFIAVTSIHLVMLYLYDGSSLSAEEGGTITVGFIGAPPSLSPASYGQDSTNDYILRFLSRSLLRYNVTTREMEGDLANCNLGKNFSEIKCYVKTDNKWSDGTPITKDDIIASYNFYKGNDSNKQMEKILANITVEDQGDYILFSGKADILMLDIFLYPIIQSDVIDKINNDKFTLSTSVSSGPYVFEKRENDERYNAEKVSFVKNNAYTGDAIYVQKYIFKFFPDRAALEGNRDGLNIIFPNDKIDSIPSPRFNTYNYLLPGYIALFLNSEKLPSELRNIILFQLGNSTYKSLDEKQGKLIKNPFFSPESITPKTLENKNIELAIERLGYFKKESLAAQFAKKSDTAPKKSDTNVFFTAPTNKKRFVTSEKELLLSGNAPEGVTTVYINDYELKSFVPSTHKFYFRAKLDIGTMKEGLNTYALSFGVNGKKTYKETLSIFYTASPDELAKKQKEFSVETTLETVDTLAEGKKQEQEKKAWADKIAPLDPLYYYNKDLKKFSINLSYSPDQSSYIKPLADNIREVLKLVGINTELHASSAEDFQKNTIELGQKNYDMLLTGIDLGLTSYNIFPFFHSGQAAKGFNFSKIKNVALDILLERLKSSQLNPESLTRIKQDVLDILKKENVVLTFYSPYHSFFIDKNLKDVKDTDILPSPSYLYDLGEGVYIKEHRSIDFKQKGIRDFSAWIAKNSPFVASLITK